MSAKRRLAGEGSLYRQKGSRIWWMSYRGPDGKRKQESSHSPLRGVARRLLLRRNGAREHNLPVIKHAEQLTFYDASQAVIDDFTTNKKKSLKVVRRRIDKHLRSYFGNRRILGIARDDVVKFIAFRQGQGVTNRKGERVGDVSNAEINRELQLLKRMFTLAIKSGRIAMRPDIPMLAEDNVRQGFFEPQQYQAVLGHLPEHIQSVITFAYITGWRIRSEVLGLEWRQIDFDGAEVRLEPGTTKNKKGRTFPFTAAVRTLLQAQWTEHEKLKKAGHICPKVFWRMVADERGGEKKPRRILDFTKEWKKACIAAGCPGRIPHDLRRTAVRNLVRAGIPQTVAMKLTGHKTDSVFRRYDIVSDLDLKDAARRLDDVATCSARAGERAFRP
jgi:integrase